ncbi:ArsR/SmtB family transcription factor [Candidatus Enterococcus ikei]|uniref:Winged helix-turn-helix transcriptional regulator n=1 Tax=Candidatus Enterococcus ikei TaxID=2815326 RepID=A0ABS3GVY0_9ENTE|nr:metalloregulator ArsR/SmtB family transcription factor [Enterococcus sp. DIV0869a]MBO0439043.1 winged helix-turn-helix transcriptional regulator [Enterococcus sp. DIV0869a]
MDYETVSLILKAMADPKRMKIIDLLSYRNMCACDVLKHFNFTQPTLSHHMKVLESAGIVSVSKQSQWHYYTLREDFVREFMHSMTLLLSDSGTDCLCQNNKAKSVKTDDD